jgi:hypothetical protein
MREYDDYGDDSIRLYTPVLQRVIILAAVVIAVPVLMWTITTFVRSYVARPKAPLVEHIASTNAPTRVPLLAAPPGQTPSAADLTPRAEGASDASNPSGETKKGTLNLAALPSSNSPNSVPAAASLQATPTLAPSPAAPASDSAMTAAATTASVPRLPQAPRANDSTASASADRGIAWPNPNATSPPDFTAPRLAPAPPLPMRTTTTEILPAGEPFRGPVPLPRQRPRVVSVAATMAASMATPMVATTAGGGPVPLPRARPGDVPAPSDTIVDLPVSGRLELENAH